MASEYEYIDNNNLFHKQQFYPLQSQFLSNHLDPNHPFTAYNHQDLAGNIYATTRLEPQIDQVHPIRFSNDIPVLSRFENSHYPTVPLWETQVFDAIDVRTLSTFDYYPPAKGKTHTSTEPSYQLGNTDHNVNKRFIPYELPQVAIPPQLKETHISPAPKQSSGGSKAPEKRAVVASANNSSPYYRSKLPTQVKPIGKDTIIPRLPGISNATMIPKKVKGACAACKKRKISCGVPSMPGSNACNQCWKLGVECDYYNPKN